MFDTLGSFAAVYFALAAILLVLILFEKPLIDLEDKWRAKRRQGVKNAKNNG